MLLRYKLLIALSILALLIVLPLHSIVHSPNLSPASAHFGKVEIIAGDNLVKIAEKLEAARLVDNANKFIWACRVMRVEKMIPAGIFTIPFGLSNYEIVQRMLFHGMNTANVTFREGWSAGRIAGALQKKLGVDSTAFMNAVNDTVFTRGLGIEAPSLEGYLFPETYNLYLGADPYDVAKKMVGLFREKFTDSLKYRAFELGFSVNDILTLASIVEGEIIYTSEAPIVAGVYHNRLKRGMRLQADPTIQYIIPDGPRRLLLKDLKTESPYNTYLNKGLPPGPIGNPGMRAILGALYPKDIPYLYFVAKGDGYHYFNTTIEGHLADKRKFNRYRRRHKK
ncbi:MAG: endolytic transglycosylase MltG [candidate division Zixibacteria bacterium]|nr:endolytic transglycosylase MltG [Candidatus Tariuqbacter arcticus]